MVVPERPLLRPLEVFPVGQQEDLMFGLRDPEGLGKTVVLSYPAVILATLMDGNRTLAELQTSFGKQMEITVALADIEELLRQLETAHLLAGDDFETYRCEEVAQFVNASARPAAHVGQAYADDPDQLRADMAAMFADPNGPGAIGGGASGDPETAQGSNGRSLCGVVAPHIDFERGGPVFAWAYEKILRQSDADLFVVFGTAHNPMHNLFCATRKDFETPLGTVRTDRRFIDRLAEELASSVAGRQIDLFEDEIVHRYEHSIEFQTTFLQFILGDRREFRIAPILVGSFHEFIAEHSQPDDSPEVQAFLAAMQAAVADYPGKVCFVSGADLAHIGRRFGDEWAVDSERLRTQADDDRKLLDTVCRGDAAAFFEHVAGQSDRSRICGLPPTYTMLRVMQTGDGELLKYSQAVEPDESACVSFAGLAFYGK